MKARSSTDTALLIGGAVLGVAAMYFMDPEVGGRRRRPMAAAAGGAYDHARSRSAIGCTIFPATSRIWHIARPIGLARCICRVMPPRLPMRLARSPPN